MKFSQSLMKLLVFLLMHSVGKPDLLYHIQRYGNHTMSIARKTSVLCWHGVKKLEFFRSPFLVWLRSAEVCTDKFTDFRLRHTPYLYVHISVAQLCLVSQILPLVSHKEAKKYLNPWMTWGLDLSGITAFICLFVCLLLGILFKLH